MSRQVPDTLVKAAYTGVAASGIGGKTCHVIANLSLRISQVTSKETITKLRRFWRGKRYLIIDEYSMIGKSFMARMSRNISMGMDENASPFRDHSFGGLNVILFGDLHQFPPVAVKRGEPLYKPIDSVQDTMDSQIGRRIYDEFTTVVVLQKQNRVTDTAWKELLSRLRVGEITDHDVKIVKSLVLTPQSMTSKDMVDNDWSEACLVTPRHSVRQYWNDAALRQLCMRSGQPILVCIAEDTVTTKKKSDLGTIVHNEGDHTDRQQKTPPVKIEIAVGMKVMVTENLETDLDVTNGARGEIVGVVLHPDEPPLPDESVTSSSIY